jgi:sporulation related protein
VPNDIPSRFPRNDYEAVAELDIAPAGHRTRRHSSGLDRGTKRLAIIAGGIGGGLLVIVGAWSLAGHRDHAVPVLEGSNGPVRVKPDNPGGMQVTGADETILSGSSGKESEALAPPPEAPEPKALQAQREAEQAKPVSPAPTPKTLPPAAAAPSGALPPVAATKPVAVPPERTGVTAHQLTAKKLPSPAHPATVQPAVSPPKPGSVSHGPVAAAGPGHPPSHSNEVQLAALQSEEAAKTEWGRLAKRMPDLFNGRHPVVVRAERDGHVYWRLRMGGFGDAGQATQFCEHVRAKGAGCSVVSF